MWKYIVKRLVAMAVTLIGITITVFLIIHMAPGDPVTKQLSEQGSMKASGKGQVTAEKLKKFKDHYNLDKPWFLNLRPYMDFSGMVNFYVDFLARPLEERKQMLKEFHTGEREEGYEYLASLKIPQFEKSLENETQRENLAEKTIREAILLNLPDYSTWVIPVLVKRLQKTQKKVEAKTGDLNKIREKLEALKGQITFDEIPEEEGERKAKKLIAELNESLTETFPEYETGLPRRVPEGEVDDKKLKQIKYRWNYWWSQYSEDLDSYFPSYRKETVDENLEKLSEKPDEAFVLENFEKKDLQYIIEKLQKTEKVEAVRNAARVLSVMSEELDLTIQTRITDRSSTDQALAVANLWGDWWKNHAGLSLIRQLEPQTLLLNISAKRPFPYTFKRNDKELEKKAQNVTFIWNLWWNNTKHRFQPVTEKRRKEVDKILNKLGDLPAKERVNIIRYQLKKSDLAHVITRMKNAEDPRFVALASQVLIRSIGGEEPVKTQINRDASLDEIYTVITLWNRWWQQERDRYEFSFLGKVWHTFSQTQYSLYMANLARLRFGETMSKPHEPVLERIGKAALRTAPLVAISSIFIYLIAIPLGIVCAVEQGTLFDRGISLSLFILYSIPGYAAAMVLLSVFANPNLEVLNIFPIHGVVDIRTIFDYAPWEAGFYTQLADYMHHAILPVFCLTIFSLAALSQYSRTSMLEVIREDYIRTARAKGLPESVVILKHVVRNGLNPLITLFAGFLNVILGGSVIIEKIFEIDGMGLLFLDAATNRDYNLLMGLLVLNSILVLIGILVSDLLYVVADPRISFEEVEK